MGIALSITRVAAFAILLSCGGLVMAGPPASTPATQPIASTQPANDQPAAADADAELHRKELREQWLQSRQRERDSLKMRWGDSAVLHTFKLDALVHLAFIDGSLTADAADLGSIGRVAVEGSGAIWTFSSPQRRPIAPGVPSFVSITRFDFDAKDTQFWQTRLMISDHSVNFYARNLYGSTSVFQSGGSLIVRVTESPEAGQPAKLIFDAKSPSLARLRAQYPSEFRKYLLPILTQFADPSFLQPGPADVYSVFAEIAADQKVLQEIQELAPGLDSDDPDERDAASAKLFQLGNPGVLAALRFDVTDLSQEQKIRLRSFVTSHRRRAPMPSAVAARDLNFLIDCLEYDDPAVRSAAKAALERYTQGEIAFDPTIAPSDAAGDVDALRKRLLAAPPPLPATTAPAVAPAPQS